MNKSKTRRLEDYEVDSLISKITSTDPTTLYPLQREVWDDIRKWITRGQLTGNVYLSDKQCAVIHKAFWRSQTTISKLQNPINNYDVNDRLDVIANPIKPLK